MALKDALYEKMWIYVQSTCKCFFSKILLKLMLQVNSSVFFVTLIYKKTRVHKLTSIFTKCNAELNTINMTLTYF